MNANEKLRHDRLVFYQQDVERIDRVLSEFLRLSGARCALLVDKEGHAVTSQGDLRQVNMDTISALVAGSFAATREMARLLGEEQFSALFHQGQSDNIQLSLVGDRTLLTVLFDDKTTVGMVRLYAGECGRKLEEVFKDTLTRKSTDNPTLQATYGASAKDRLASLFGLPEK
jgi:predicted regulator of Ras-like GTPase activity (Roadblock/LC7/MglB family)